MGSHQKNRSFLRLLSYITTFAFAVLILASGLSVFAQVDEGSITGVVTDQTGAVVPNAKVTLLNTDQGLTLEATTTSAGEYTFSPVRIGHYTVSIAAPGFATTTQQNLTVNVSQNLRVNVQLKPGSATQTVEVTAAPPQLQTEDASVGQTMNQQSVNNLPLNGRNFTFLAQLGAGVNTPQADTRGNAASGAFSANGLRPAQNNYLLDGIDNNSDNVDFLNGTNFVALPPVDAIQEFKVETGNFSAEFGRAAGAVLNATVKSGTNQIHGTVWEFFRNDKLDAADFFENNNGIPKSELRWNQFGALIGGPIIKNKLFYFGDYEGFRRVQGNTQSGFTVPTVAERNSGYTNLSDLITAQASSAPRADALGRLIPVGTVLDPATTRPVGNGQYVRDPFGLNTCSGSTISLANCPGLNQIPANRLDANAISLLNLYPLPTSSSVFSNFASSPNIYEHSNRFDVRGDYDPSEKNQIFARNSYSDDPQYIPGPFGGIADGGAFQQGIQTAKSDQVAVAWTHMFTPSMINVARVGFSHIHTTRFGPNGTTLGIPAQFGIQGIPQVSENGGLPQFNFSGLSQLGSNAFLPSDETTQTWQVTDDFTKVYGAHSFKVGFEFQHVQFNTLQPAWSRGQLGFNSNNSALSYTDIPNVGGGQTGRAQFLLDPIPSTVPGGVDYVGGADQVQASNINKTYDARKYVAGYVQDDWKVNPKLTLNLGLRWDYFGPISETNGGQANFVASGPPYNSPVYLIPATGKDNRQLSSSFLDLTAKDGIRIQFGGFGKGLVQTQQANIGPRLGFAYQATPKLVTRGGVGFFYNAFENQGYGPNIGENYPFVFNFNYQQQNFGTPSVSSISTGTPWAGCGAAAPSFAATISAGLACISFSPLSVNASGLGLQGLQFKYKTPRTVAANLSAQYSITPTLSAQIGYVMTWVENLQTGVGTNNVGQLVPAGTSTKSFLPFPDFGSGSSYQQTVGRSVYNGLQTKLEQHFNNGLNYLVTYTFAKTLSDAGDLLNGGSLQGYRAPDVPGFGIRRDWGPADFDIRNVFHLSGGYQLPFGKGQRFLHDANGLVNNIVGGWSINSIVTLQGGQPITLNCPTSTTSGTNCYDVRTGQPQRLGIKVRPDANGIPRPFWFGNPAAFQQPCLLGGTATTNPSGCVPSTGFDILGWNQGTTTGPGFRRWDFSTFKAFQLTERFSLQFRAEFFNILNRPNFNAPNFGGNGVVAIGNSGNFTSSTFGQIGSTRDAPFDPRQIQFALKLYF